MRLPGDMVWIAVAPHLLVLVTMTVVLLSIIALAHKPRREQAELAAMLTSAGLAATLVLLVLVWDRAGIEAFGRCVALDHYGLLLSFLLVGATLLVSLISPRYLELERIESGEYYFLLLSALFGAICMVATNDLLIIFLGLEIMSISIYVLAGLLQRQRRSGEAALKYFLLGAFATAFLLYGMALLYGQGGSTHLREIARSMPRETIVGTAGIGLLIVGLGFKIAAVPFHMWTPDVYDGAPTPVTGLMAAVVKIAAFAALLRVIGELLGPFPAPVHNVWVYTLTALAVITMTYGNVVALVQRNIKRMLAYSSIAHAGYMLVGLAALFTNPNDGAGSLLYYLTAYTLMNIGAFAVVIVVSGRNEQSFDIEGYAGLAARRPGVALAMAVCLFSLAGIPPLAGFFGKYYLFIAAMRSGLVGLVIVAVLNSALSVYFYIRIVYLMYMREPVAEQPPTNRHWGLSLALGLCAVAVLLLGLFPNSLLRLIAESLGVFF
ncbi:MAG: NADH-quinone oxidoreductase subunit N [Candidatus Alcyoniella australis]|nr:NADH-quinone oxidoreductase subunit N [Candidatus Alcyoniella australis]